MKLLNQFNMPLQHRRRFIKHLSYSALALPFYRTFMETQVFAANSPVRMLLFTYPDGTVKGKFFPTSSASYPEGSKALSAVDKEVNFYDGLDYPIEGTHGDGVAYMFTGGGKMQSIDHYVGSKLGANMPLKTLALGALSNFQSNSGPSMENGKEVKAEDNPTKAFLETFGGVAAKPSNPEDANKIKNQQAQALKAKRSILDSQVSEIKSLQKQLGNTEKAKLTAHLDALRELERRIQAMEMDQGGGGKVVSATCNTDIDRRGLSIPEQSSGYPAAHENNDDYDAIIDVQLDILVQALACGKTLVGVMHFSHDTSNLSMNFKGAPSGVGGSNIHGVSHYGDANGASAKAYLAMQNYHMGKIANTIKQMSAIKEGDESLLYNSTMMAATALGDGDSHTLKGIPIISAGQSGGKIKTGLKLKLAGKSHNHLLISMLHGLGIMDTTFGNAAGGSGPLAEIMA